MLTREGGFRVLCAHANINACFLYNFMEALNVQRFGIYVSWTLTFNFCSVSNLCSVIYDRLRNLR
jgi:hypothetical protein